MSQVPSSSVPGFPDPDLTLQPKELQSFGLRLPNNPMTGTNAARAPGASTDGVHPQESWTTGTLVPLVAKYLNQ